MLQADYIFAWSSRSNKKKQCAGTEREPEYHHEMESEHFENDRSNETGTAHKKETVCDQPPVNTVSGRSIIFLKDMD